MKIKVGNLYFEVIDYQWWRLTGEENATEFTAEIATSIAEFLRSQGYSEVEVVE